MHKKNHSSREKGSALLVTIMITSVVLLFAIILLERIIPYSKQIRSLQDSVQSYYEARSQVELAKQTFGINRENIDTDSSIQDRTDGLSLIPPDLSSEKPGKYVIISEHTTLPLHIRLFEEDTDARGFGVNNQNAYFHTLSSLTGLLFDLSNRDTTNFSMEITSEWEDTTTAKNIVVEFIHSNRTTVSPFFGNLKWNNLDKMDIADAKSASGESLGDKLRRVNCISASCSLKISLTSSAPMLFPVSLSLSTAIPDLNAIIVADGLSKNTTYHSRIIELIPLIQGI
jgi:type II secretory pathway pseudopilin PulG